MGAEDLPPNDLATNVEIKDVADVVMQCPADKPSTQLAATDDAMQCPASEPSTQFKNEKVKTTPIIVQKRKYNKKSVTPNSTASLNKQKKIDGKLRLLVLSFIISYGQRCCIFTDISIIYRIFTVSAKTLFQIESRLKQ